MAQETFFRICLDPLPELLFLRDAKTDPYRLTFRGMPRQCEIGYIQKGAIRELRAGQPRLLEAGTFYTFTRSVPLEHAADHPDQHEFCVSFFVCEDPVPITRQEAANWIPQPGEALLPDHVTDPAVCRRLEPLFKKMIHLYNGAAPMRNLLVQGLLLELLSILSEQAITQARFQNRGAYGRELDYCSRACTYIAENLTRRISTASIAAHTGISYTHLNRLFTRVMGTTLVEHINRERLRLADYYILHHGMTQDEAALAVGFCDAKYMRRLFRRYNGVTITQYHRMEQNF